MQRIVSQAGMYAAAKLSSDASGTPQYNNNNSNSNYNDNNDITASGLVRHRVSGTLTALCISPDGESVAVAGREGIP